MAVGNRLTAAAMLVSVCVVDEDVFVVWVPLLEASCWAGREVATVMVSGEEEGGEGLRRAVKFTADGEGCIRASEKERLLFPQDDRLSWGVNHPLDELQQTGGRA
jgi:hypothetical protein